MSPRRPANGQYFATDPAVESRRGTVELALPEGRLLTFVTDRGTFSPDQVDAGTKTLLVDTPIPAGTNLVDLGCGYGPIAVTMALRAAQDATVWAVDVNERARDLCRENAERNGVGERVKVVAPEDVPEGLVVDTLWSNPPIRIGKAALHELLVTWLDRLEPARGAAELVVHKHLGADSLTNWLLDRGYDVTRRSSRAGYRVLAVRRRAAR